MYFVLKIILIIIIVFFIVVMIRDANRFRVVAYTVLSDKIIKDTDMVILSDLHNKSYGKDNEKLLQAIEKLQPDGILVAGDILTAKAGQSMKTAITIIQNLAEKYPVYYGMGNHEYRLRIDENEYGDMYRRYERAINEVGVEFMTNTRTILSQSNIEICGLEIERCFYKKSHKPSMNQGYVESKVGKARKDVFQLLIAHNPEYFDSYADWGADLVVSGHVHGGVMNCPFLGGVISPSFRLFPKYDGGVFKKNGSTMIVSRGLGMHTIPIRIFNPGELIIVHLQHKSS